MKRIYLLAVLLGMALSFQSTASSQVIISEFMADNKSSLADENGDFVDWIELYNIGSAPVSLAVWALTDDPTGAAKWYFPATNISAKAFMVVFASGKNRKIPGAPLHTDFNIRASGEYLALLRPDGSAATEFAPSTPPQYAGFSYGISQDVRTNILLRPGTPLRWQVPSSGALGDTWRQHILDDSTWRAGNSGLGYQTAVPGFAVSNIVAAVGVCSLQTALDVLNNPAQQIAVFTENAPVINYLNTSSSAHFGSDATFPGLGIGQDQDNFLTYAKATITIPSAGEWTFGVNSDDGFALQIGGHYGEYPNPRGPGDTFMTFYFDNPGDYDLNFVFYECGGGAEVELFAAQGPHSSFNASAFKLAGAPGGLAVRSLPVGSGSGGTTYDRAIATNTREAMESLNASAYVRVPFLVQNAASVQSLTLRMLYDDGFVAYLNGQEVARRNAPATPSWNSSATASHQAGAAEEINITDFLGSLVSGTNILAIQGLNQSAADSDFLLAPELVEYVALGTSLKYFAKPSPGALNGAGFAAFVQDTHFSVDRGLFTVPFTLSITTATAGASIVYTTDGSVPTLGNGTVYTGPLTISKTTALRASAFKDGFVPSNPDTQTYLFLADVVRQSLQGEPPPGWPGTWGGNVVDYGMDPNIMNNQAYGPQMIPSLRSLPSFSIVTDLDNLFDPGYGIYANPGQDGIGWERPTSLELIYPDGKKGFQVEAGLRIRGGYSRSTGNPKHGLRLLFRSEYGDAQLNYPLFAKQGGAESFDSFDLRTFQNYSWSFGGDHRFIGLRDQWNRDTQLAMGQQAERGDMYHLYINGQYWGIYNTDERPEAAYAASYFGGVEEDYDVVKVEAGIYTINATDGNLDAWHRLWRAATNGFGNNSAYYSIQGKNADGTMNPALEDLLDVDNLIDYMLLVFYTGNIDAPISDFLGNERPNNFYAIRNRTGKFGGFRFMSHDGEHTLHHESSLSNQELTRDRTGPFAAGDPTSQGGSAFSYSNPQYVFTRLTANADFRSRLADRIQKHFFNDGALTVAANRSRFLVRSNEMYAAVIAESARWGDSKVEPPLTRNQWATEMGRVYNSYFGQRSGTVLSQFRTKGWFPNVVAPTFAKHGGVVNTGFSLGMSAPEATIWYTTDGSDPRRETGGISANAKTYSAPVALNTSAVIKARVRNTSGTWSALNEATFYVTQSYGGLLITEIMYNPVGGVALNGEDFEFIELKNLNSTNIELSGLRFTNGINYVFPPGLTLAPRAFHVMVSNPALFTNRYPGIKVGGVFTNHLSNGGETLTLVHADGKPVFSVSYGTRLPWPPLADGEGFSLVSANPSLNPAPDDARNWRASTLVGGSPGADDPSPLVPPIFVNEVLSRSVLPEVDWVELYNPNGTNVSIAGWFLTDDRAQPRKYQFPTGTVVPAGGYFVVSETEWNVQPGPAGAFAFSAGGDEVYLYSASTNGGLTGYAQGFSFAGTGEGITFGRYVNSASQESFPAQATATRGAANSGPRQQLLAINEIHYKPAVGGDEFLEIKSITNGVLALYDAQFGTNAWRVSGVSFEFPPNTQLAPNSLALLVKTNPAAFRSKYNVSATVPIFGPYTGSLQGGGETLTIEMPVKGVTNSEGVITIPYMDGDTVRYDDAAPWPVLADGLGYSLERMNPRTYGSDPLNWRASTPPSPGIDTSGNRAPVVDAGQNRSLEATAFPVAVSLSGMISDDGQLSGAVTSSWTIVSAPTAAWIDAPSQAVTTAHFQAAGTYLLRLTGSDGELQASDDLTITVSRPVSYTNRALVAAGSSWKYLDNGSDQGTAWTAVNFNDTTWASGVGPLGYGDAAGVLPATTVGFGPESTNKYITTYFRKAFAVPDPASLTNLQVTLQRDDGVVVFLNGVAILTNNLPDTGIGYRTLALSAVGGQDELAFIQRSLSATALLAGTNVIAVEVHQSGPDSTDLFFDLALSALSEPLNAAPVVDAGTDITIPAVGAVLLAGSVLDDGLPGSGLMTLTWSKVSGPGVVTFSTPALPRTAATITTDGTYVVRLTATDGAFTVSDDVTVQVGAAPLGRPSFSSIARTSAEPSSISMSFMAEANQTYTVQYADAPAGEAWQKLQDVSSQPQARKVTVSDGTLTPRARFYRIVSPAVN